MTSLSLLLATPLPFTYKQTTTITSSQTWTVPSNIRSADDGEYYVWVTMCGGGGSGGVAVNIDSDYAAGSGGQAGDFCIQYKVQLGTGPGENISITIGPGASGVSQGASNGSSSGNNGGSSSFGGYITVSGGGAGAGSQNASQYNVNANGGGRIGDYGYSSTGYGSAGAIVRLSGDILSSNLVCNGSIGGAAGGEKAVEGGPDCFNGYSAGSGADALASGGGGGAGLFGPGTNGAESRTSSVSSASAGANTGAGSGGTGIVGSYTASSGASGSGKCVIEYYSRSL